MRDRGGLAAAIGLVALFGVLVLGLLTATLPGLPHGWPAVVHALRALPAITPQAARAGQRAIEAAAVGAVTAAVLALPVGLALSVLPARLAWLGRALLAVPGCAVALAAVLATALTLSHASLAEAASAAWIMVRQPLGPRATLAVLWLPVLAAGVDAHARHADPAQARALAGLGVPPLGRLWRLTLPVIAGPLLAAAATVFLVSAIGLLLLGRPAVAEPSPADIAAVAVVTALVVAPLWAWISRPR